MKVTIKLKSTSDSNDVFSNTHSLDKETGKGIMPLLVKDLSGRMMLFAGETWVTKLPTVSREKEAGTNEWILETGSAEMFVGGN